VVRAGLAENKSTLFVEFLTRDVVGDNVKGNTLDIFTRIVFFLNHLKELSGNPHSSGLIDHPDCLNVNREEIFSKGVESEANF